MKKRNDGIWRRGKSTNINPLLFQFFSSSLRETKSACRVVIYQKETNDALPRLIEPGRLGTLLIEWMLSQSNSRQVDYGSKIRPQSEKTGKSTDETAGPTRESCRECNRAKALGIDGLVTKEAVVQQVVR